MQPMGKRCAVHAAPALVAAAVLTGAAAAADYPAKPVKMVAAYAAGGGGDILTRLVASKMALRWKQSVLVENRPGAGTTLATAAVAQAPADGYTLLMNGNTMLVSSATYPKLPYDVARDLAPITIIAASPFLVVTRAGPGVESMPQLIDYARRNPGKLNYGSSGSGTFAHLAAERAARAAPAFRERQAEGAGGGRAAAARRAARAADLRRSRREGPRRVRRANLKPE